MFKRKAVYLLLLGLLSAHIIVTPKLVRAETSIIINGNGNDSSTEIILTLETQTNIKQQNSTQVNNNVQTTTTTGNNETSQNQGGNQQIITGDINQSTEIINHDLSINSTTAANSSPATNIQISTNGNDSTNSISVSGTSNTQLTQFNNTAISTSITQNAVTGQNTANNNSGNSSIITGSGI